MGTELFSSSSEPEGAKKDMNKLILLLALAVVALQAVSGYEDETDREVEALEAGHIQLTDSHPRAVLNRVIREAERRGKGRKKAKNNRKRKVKNDKRRKGKNDKRRKGKNDKRRKVKNDKRRKVKNDKRRK